MDVVYLLKNSQTNEELVYSLRSLVNIPHDKVFLVGGCPSEINREKVIYVPVIQGGNKYLNTSNSLKVICEDSRLSKEFILMNDDFFILKPIKEPKEELNLCRGTIKEVIAEMESRLNCCTTYLAQMRETLQFLSNLGYKQPLSYELHIPIVMDKEKILGLFSRNYINNAVTSHKRSIYGNVYLWDSKPIKDVKVYANMFLPLGSDKFLSTEDMSWPRVSTFIKKLFPSKSPYEL